MTATVLDFPAPKSPRPQLPPLKPATRMEQMLQAFYVLRMTTIQRELERK